MEAHRFGLAQAERRAPHRRRSEVGARRRRRILLLSGAGRQLARRADGCAGAHGGAARPRCALARVHAEGDQGGEDAHELDQSEQRLETPCHACRNDAQRSAGRIWRGGSSSGARGRRDGHLLATRLEGRIARVRTLQGTETWQLAMADPDNRRRSILPAAAMLGAPERLDPPRADP